MERIEWKSNKQKDDFTAKIGNYLLRVEQMDKGSWWWSASYNNKQILIPLNEFASSKNKAIGLSEGVYFGHFSANKKYEKCINVIRRFDAGIIGMYDL